MLTQDAHAEVTGTALPMLKARPATEGDARFVYTEPSNERWDDDSERVRQKALAASAEHYLRFGNIDLNHLTLFGWKMGLANPHLFEIGKPVEVIADGRRFLVEYRGGDKHVRIETGRQYADMPIWVKAEVYRGNGVSAAQANFFWSSLTEQSPAQDWYPSVGGTKPQKRAVGDSKAEIIQVRWSNIGFAKEPVNKFVSPLTLVPPSVFGKAVTAGYGTDVAALTGGGALRLQSHEKGVLHAHQGGGADAGAYRRASVAYFRQLRPSAEKPSLASIAAFLADHAGVPDDTAKVWARRLLASLRSRLQSPTLREAA